MIKESNITDNQMIKICKIMKTKCGKSIRPSQLKKKMRDRKKLIDSCFDLVKVEFEDKKGNRFEKDVFIGNIVKVKEIVEGIRNINEIEKETIVSIDGGKGILKIVANFIPKNSSESTSKYRDSGARKSIVVFPAEGVDETYFNIKKAIDMIELDKINLRMLSDL